VEQVVRVLECIPNWDILSCREVDVARGLFSQLVESGVAERSQRDAAVQGRVVGLRAMLMARRFVFSRIDSSSL